jgi:hypothetical protein
MENLCCVKCESILDRGTYAGVEVDLCPECGGLWLDKGELEALGTASPTQVSDLRNMLTGNPFAQPAASDIPTECPSCEGKLREVVLGPIHVDFCTNCGGVFLDRGELDKGLEASKGKGDLAALLRVAVAAAK